MAEALTSSPFVCMDCGSRADAEEPCAKCNEPRLDLRKSAVKLA